ncbi:hypothetical protein KAZ01_02175, partial [Candidatus Gracilibacteria bacterium]|nr:hypothetical protein [Candidatus Gracilibacteria bacterium]
GGAFDKKGDFIGIPYSASIGYSTLGYMIPVSKIKDFLADKGDITNYNKTDANFIVYINKINTSILEQKVTNQYFQFDNFTQKNFSLQEVNDNNPSTKQSEYYFLSKTEKTNISITVNETLGNEYYNYAQDVKSLKESYSKVAVKSNITLGGKKINKLIALFGPKKPDGVIDKNTISLVFVLNGITFSIYTNHYNSEKQAFNNAFSLFIKNFKLKNNSLINNETNYKIVAGTFQIIPEMNFNKFVGYTSFYFNSNLNNYGNVSVTKEKDDGGKYSLNNYTFDEWAKENLYLSSSNKNEIQKNSFGAYYIRAKETEKNGRINYFDTFITKINDDIYIVYINFSIQESNSKLENNYNQFINSINLNGSIPFKNAVTGELKLDDTKK